MARVRAYIKPFLIDGTYGEWGEVTNDVIAGSIGSISRALDVSEFDIGVFTNSSVSMELRNDHGRYSDIDSAYSIFRYRRAGSLVRLTGTTFPASVKLGKFRVARLLFSKASSRMRGPRFSWSPTGLDSASLATNQF